MHDKSRAVRIARVLIVLNTQVANLDAWDRLSRRERQIYISSCKAHASSAKVLMKKQTHS